MFSLTKRKSVVRMMALADIRSEGVHLALIKSELGAPNPEILWSHFEAFPCGHLERGNEVRLQGFVRSAIKTLEMDGMRYLLQNFPDLSPSVFKVTVSAPLSETVARGLKFSGKFPVDLSTDLIDEISYAPQLLELPLDEKFEKRLGLTAKAGPVMSLGQNLYQMVSVLPAPIYNELVSAHGRFLPTAEFRIEPKIGHYLDVVSDLPHSTDHICLIDLTGSATELCVVDNGEIKNVSHTSYGTDDIISKLAQSLNIPESEAEHLFRDNDVNSTGSLSADKNAILEDVFNDYEVVLSNLLKKNSSDGLPSTVFLHTGSELERFLRDRLLKLDLWSERPTIHPITPKLWGYSADIDTPLLVTAILFHKKGR